MSNGQIGAAFKPLTHKLEDAPEPPVRDDSKFGAAFKPQNTQGIPCPHCGCRHFTKTVESRANGNRIKREKTCRACNKKFITFEALPESPAN